MTALKYEVDVAVVGAGAAGIMLYGISLVAGHYGTGYLPEIVRMMEMGGYSDSVVLMGMFFVLIGIGFKLAAVPFHFWCPDVFEGAAAEVAAFLSVASKGAALALLARITLGPFVGAWRYATSVRPRLQGATVALGKEELTLSCAVERYSLSAHADAGQIAAAVTRAQPRTTVLVHGEPDTLRALAKRVTRHHPQIAVNGEPITLIDGAQPAQRVGLHAIAVAQNRIDRVYMRLEGAPALEAIVAGDRELGLMQLGIGLAVAQFVKPLLGGLPEPVEIWFCGQSLRHGNIGSLRQATARLGQERSPRTEKGGFP